MAGMAYGQTSRFDELSRLPFEQNRPTQQTAQTLKDELLFQRATQTYLWAMPLLNTLGMKVGAEEAFGTGYNVMPIWMKRLDAKTHITTPNSDLICGMAFANLGETGPLVFEAPPKLQGILLDFWQRPIPLDGGKFFGDVGLPVPTAARRQISDPAPRLQGGTCRPAIMSIVPAPTTSSSSCGRSIWIPGTRRRPST